MKWVVIYLILIILEGGFQVYVWISLLSNIFLYSDLHSFLLATGKKTEHKNIFVI